MSPLETYTPHQWHDDLNPTSPDPVHISAPYGPLDAARLGAMEAGILAAIMGSGLVYNPLHPTYGAIGDGASDDHAAVQAAADAAAGKGILWLPTHFAVSQSVKLQSDTAVFGVGKNLSSLIAIGGTPTVLASKQAGGMVQRLTLRDFSLVGDGVTANQRGLQLAGVELSDIRNLRASGFTSSGALPIELTSWNDGGTYRPSRENELSNLETNGIAGIKLTKNGSDPSTSGSNNNKLIAPRCSAYTGIGIDIDAGEGNSIYGGVCSTPTDATIGIRVNDDVNALYSCNTDCSAGGGNTAIGVKVESGVNDTFIICRTGNGPTTPVLDNGTNTIILRHPLTHLGGTVQFGSATTGIGFFGAATHGLIPITGSRGGNVALANLLSALATYGLITDSTT